MFVINDGEEDIVSFSGECTLPAGVSLSSVHVQNPSSGYSSVPGTSVQINGNSFEITGFSALKPATTYEVITVFSGVPGGLYKVELEAGY